MIINNSWILEMQLVEYLLHMGKISSNIWHEIFYLFIPLYIILHKLK